MKKADVKDIDILFKKAMDNSSCNTSYPLNKESWLNFKKDNYDLFFDERKMSFYIHIPFCKSLCSFCEYIKFKKNSDYEKKYLDILEQDINNFISNHSIDMLYGFDIGGGTPTALDINNFKKLMDIAYKINHNFNYVKDYEPSIEATFITIDEEKIKLIKEAGFKRISLGIQTVNTKILLDNNRDVVSIDNIKKIVDIIKDNGLKVNLDLMYGLPNKTLDDVSNSIKIIKMINPNQVTLYEMRYNMVKYQSKFTKDELYKYYELFYKGFIKLGYIADFGQNTFSKTNDLGLSSYLKHRMIDNISYKGFGISAQSKSNIGLSYNIGKSGIDFSSCIKDNSFIEEDIYVLPKEELLAKYIAVSLYYGKFKLSIMEDILKTDPMKYYKDEFNYLINHKYIIIDKDIVSLTKDGFKYFGAIGALFYPLESKRIVMGDENV